MGTLGRNPLKSSIINCYHKIIQQPVIAHHLRFAFITPGGTFPPGYGKGHRSIADGKGGWIIGGGKVLVGTPSAETSDHIQDNHSLIADESFFTFIFHRLHQHYVVYANRIESDRIVAIILPQLRYATNIFPRRPI